MKRMKDFTEEEVKTVYRMRANNVRWDKVAEAVGSSSWTVRQIVVNDTRPDVDINDKIKEQAKSAGRKVAPRKRKGNGSPDCYRNAVADYIGCCINLEKARSACLKLGVNPETLDLLREAERR